MRYFHNFLIRMCSFIFVAAVLYNVYYYTILEDKSASEVTHEMQAVKHNNQNWSSENELEYDDFSLKDIKLGVSRESVLKRLGEPKGNKQMLEGASYIYDDVEVIIGADNTVINILTDKKTTCTRRNIHPGSKLEAVMKAYGEVFRKTTVNGLDLYEYNWQDAKASYVLRFAVQAENNEVNYIGCRIERPKN